ncbi:MAG: DNA/RNA nuclease SfsA [Deltaproteobacteria bacterium]|jgi:sugar fermentation stimulation protein A|nr:DNA/RNA nuclease SfsA [Deltaproteobacteria bacterium]
MTAIPWPPLIKGVLIQRYKRFLADVTLENGVKVTAHTANTGSMLTCSQPGRTVYLSQSANPKRLYPYTWEMIHMPDGLVGVNTSLPNRLAYKAAQEGFFPHWPSNPIITKEPKIPSGRLDLRLDYPHDPNLPTIWVEVKNCSLVENGVALFPDAPSQRGQRHLKELVELVKTGQKAQILILVQREAKVFRPAAAIDPDFARGLQEAVANGVGLEVRRVKLTTSAATLAEPLETMW